MTTLLFTSIELGLLFSLIIFGIVLTFRILNFPDLTADGSFVTGAAVSAIAITIGIPGLVAVLLGFVAGFFAGAITALIHIKFGIAKILSGILSMSMLYTINLRLMQGPNISMLNKSNIISWFKFPLNHLATIVFLFTVVTIIKLFLDWFLNTEFGLLVQATGNNEITAKSFGANIKLIKLIVLGLANGLVGMGGSLFSQYQGFADINMGTGVIIVGLAAFMIGENFITSQRIKYITTAVIFGSILYNFIINISLRLGLAGADLKFVTALIVVIAIFLGRNKRIFYGKTVFDN